MSEPMPVRFFTTGGTIDKVYFDAKSEFHVGESIIEHILREAEVAFRFEVTPLMRKDSLDLSDADRQVIHDAVEGASEGQIIITHGTDTMAHTARTLSGIAGKTIVLVGALHPARFRSSDAIFNVGLAVGAAQTMPPGVYVAMNGRIFDGRRVTKNRAANRFEETE